MFFNRFYTIIYHLGIDTDGLAALFTSVGEYALIALDAVGMVIPEDVPLSSQRLIALPATEVARVPVLLHGFRVLPTKNQLEQQKTSVKCARGRLTHTLSSSEDYCCRLNDYFSVVV